MASSLSASFICIPRPHRATLNAQRDCSNPVSHLQPPSSLRLRLSSSRQREWPCNWQRLQWLGSRHKCTAQSQTLSSEESEEAAVEKELPSPEVAAEEAEAGPAANVFDIVKAAFESGDELAVAEAEAQVKALQADRDALVQTVDALELELSKGKDRVLRLSADFDNFRKRAEKDKLALTANVRGDVVEALLPIVDSFERAKSAIKVETEAEQRIDSSYQGIYKQFVEAMKGLGVAAVETVGQEFNPEFHEAIMKEESMEYADGIVIQEFRKGFFIGERLIRPAMVKVSTGPGPSDAVALEGSGSGESEGDYVSSED